jgi:hypothetical protein
MKLVLLGALMCIALFIAGLVAPRRSRRLQGRVNRTLRRGERKADRSASRVGNWTRDSLETARHAGDKSARAGRKSRDKLPV